MKKAYGIRKAPPPYLLHAHSLLHFAKSLCCITCVRSKRCLSSCWRMHRHRIHGLQHRLQRSMQANLTTLSGCWATVPSCSASATLQ